MINKMLKRIGIHKFLFIFIWLYIIINNNYKYDIADCIFLIVTFIYIAVIEYKYKCLQTHVKSLKYAYEEQVKISHIAIEKYNKIYEELETMKFTS